MTGITIYRIQDGQVRTTWWTYDALGLMQHLGAISAAAEYAGARA